MTSTPRVNGGAGVMTLDEALRRALDEQAAGRLRPAAQWFEAALRIDPRHAPTLAHYSLLALMAGNAQAALALSARAVDADARNPIAQHFRGLAQRRAGALADAIASVRQAVALDPAYSDAHINLGNLLLESGDAASARASYERALALTPGSAAVSNNLGNAYRELGRPDDALDAYRRALVLDPRHVEAHNNVGNMLREMADADGAVRAFRAALSVSPNRADIWSNLLLAMNASDTLTRDAIASEHRAYGAHFSARVKSSASAGVEPGEDRLRIGYVSADFRKHAVATFFVPLLEAHDRAAFSVHCYYNALRGDDYTKRIAALSDAFVPIAGMGDRDLAERIRADRIDVLIDLSGHTAGNRLTAFIHRPARVQATWLGYLSTTGLTQIDYRITDAALDPEGMTERLHTEALWRLPETSWCYAPYPESPDVTARGSDAALTFISLNNPGKCSPTVMMLWARILNEVPQSRLIVQTSPHPSRVDAVARFFEQHGVDATRLEQVARRPLRDYLALYGRADIALDSWPYTGGTTTCDALWMGVPVVSLATDRPFARSGAGMLSVVGLPDLIAADGEDYVRKSVGLARDPRRLATLRDSLRTRMQRSPMTDKVAFARAFERALRDMHARAVTR